MGKLRKDNGMMHYHAGYNMPGYLPENDEGGYVYESADDAKRAMIDILDRDGDFAFDYGDEEGKALADDLSAEMEDLNLANVEQGWDAYHGNLHYWISACSESACEEGEE